MVDGAQSWSIVIPCFNEEGNLIPLVREVQRVLSLIAPDDHEIILVDDGSTDNSPALIRQMSLVEQNISAVFHLANLGIGNALRSGYFRATRELICGMPADGQFDPRELLKLPVLPAKTFVSFFRCRREGYNLFRKTISAGNRLLVHGLSGIPIADVNWVKVYPRRELKALDLRLNSSLVESEICVKLLSRGNTCLQLPSTHRRRQTGIANGASLRTISRAACEVFMLIGMFQLRGRSRPVQSRPPPLPCPHE